MVSGSVCTTQKGDSPEEMLALRQQGEHDLNYDLHASWGLCITNEFALALIYPSK